MGRTIFDGVALMFLALALGSCALKKTQGPPPDQLIVYQCEEHERERIDKCRAGEVGDSGFSGSVSVSLATVDWIKRVIDVMQRAGSLQQLPPDCQEPGGIAPEAIGGIGVSADGLLGLVIEEQPSCRPSEENLPTPIEGDIDFPPEHVAPYSVVCENAEADSIECQLAVQEPDQTCDPRLCYPRQWDTGRINKWDLEKPDCETDPCSFWLDPMDPYIYPDPEDEYLEAELDCDLAGPLCEALQFTFEFDKSGLISQDAADGDCDGVDDGSAGETCKESNQHRSITCQEDSDGGHCVEEQGDGEYFVYWISEDSSHEDASEENAEKHAESVGNEEVDCQHVGGDGYQCGPPFRCC
ncbi:MAG: hypothetical protein HKN15_07595 [Xanthomonadales bacterium]|nr:hypothetical protein [Xanthomonadales bacterium]